MPAATCPRARTTRARGRHRLIFSRRTRRPSWRTRSRSDFLMTRISIFKQATLALAGVFAIAHSAQSQSLIVTNGTIIAATGDQAPGLPAGCLLDGAGTFDVGVMDDAGNVFFRSRLT